MKIRGLIKYIIGLIIPIFLFFTVYKVYKWANEMDEIDSYIESPNNTIKLTKNH